MTICLREIILSSGSWKIKFIKLADYILGPIIILFLKKRGDIKITSLDPQTILVIRPGGIGDAVFLLPILKNIKNNHPEIRIDILCEKRNAAIFASQGEICRQVYCYDNGSFFSIFQNSYDVIVDTEQWHYLSAIVSCFIKSKYTIGFASRPSRAKLFNSKIEYGSNEYELTSFKNLFINIFPQVNETHSLKNSYIMPEEASVSVKERIPTGSISMFLGGSLPEKRLTVDQTLSMINSILEKNIPVILLGGKDYVNDSWKIEERAPKGKLINLVNKLSLAESAATIKCSRLFIGTDSGLLHLAVAVGIPSIAIFGSSNHKKWWPKEAADRLITDNVECSPCSSFSYSLPTCNGTYICLRQLQLNKIIEKISLQS